MCSYEERLGAVKLYIEFGKRAKATIRELKPPSAAMGIKDLSGPIATGVSGNGKGSLTLSWFGQQSVV